MKRWVARWQVAGFLFTAVLGTVLHFVFDWTGGSVVAALFSAVNESIWEHLKLLYYPMLGFSFIEYAVWGKQRQDFWCIKLVGMLVGLVLIPAMYYTYTGGLGVSADWFNVTIFFIAAAAVYRLETKLFQGKTQCRLNCWAALVLMMGIGILFTVLTFATPQIPLFRDPVTGGYGF